MASTVERSKTVLIENYGRLPIAIVRAQGSEFFDESGKRYIDLFAGFGAGGLVGHSHPAVVEALHAQAQKVLSHGNLFTSEPQVAVAERLSQELPGSKVFFCHSGAEAAEAALKLARKVDPKRHKIVSFENCFHGRTMGALSLCPASFQTGFEPMLPGNVKAVFNDIESVVASVDEETAAIFVEPIQGEGGLLVPSQEFMSQLRSLCDDHNILLICDEVWTAPGRTGRFYGHQHFGITPDAVTVAKALGGGTPLAALVVREPYVEVLGPGSHGCTMGGNPLCAAAAQAAMEVMDREQLIERARQLGDQIQSRLTSLNSPAIREVRGRGLFIGIELAHQINASDVMKSCIANGVFVASAKKNVVRIAPPLTISEPVLDEGLSIVESVIRGLIEPK